MLATEFAKAGADVTQTFTFYSTDDWIDTFDCSERRKQRYQKATVALLKNQYMFFILMF
jgi:methionine synthase I (cobalamin-dependent)